MQPFDITAKTVDDLRKLASEWEVDVLSRQIDDWTPKIPSVGTRRRSSSLREPQRESSIRDSLPPDSTRRESLVQDFPARELGRQESFGRSPLFQTQPKEPQHRDSSERDGSRRGGPRREPLSPGTRPQSSVLSSVLQSLIDACKRGSDTSQLAQEVRNRFSEVIEDDRLFELPLTVIQQVINYGLSGQDFTKLFSFLLKCLDKYGSDASPLFHGINVSQLSQTQLIDLCKRHQVLGQIVNDSLAKLISNLTEQNVQAKKSCDATLSLLRAEIEILRSDVNSLSGARGQQPQDVSIQRIRTIEENIVRGQKDLNDRIKTEVATLNDARASEQKQTIEYIHRHIDNTEKRLRESVISDLQQEVKNLDDQTKLGIQVNANAIAQLQSRLNSALQDLKSSGSNVPNVAVQGLSELVTGHSASLSHLQSQMKELGTNILRERETQKHEYVLIGKEQEGISHRLDEFSQQLNDLRREMNASRQQSNASPQQLNEFGQHLNEFEQQVSEVGQHVNEVGQQVTDVGKRLNQIEQQVNEFQQQRQEDKDIMADVLKKYHDKEDRQPDFRTELDILRADIRKELRMLDDKNKTQILDNANGITKLTTRVNTELAEIRQQVSMIIRELCNDPRSPSGVNSPAQQPKAEQSADVQALVSEMKSVLKEQDDRRQEYEDLKKNQENVGHELTEIRQQSEEIKATIEQFQVELLFQRASLILISMIDPSKQDRNELAIQQEMKESNLNLWTGLLNRKWQFLPFRSLETPGGVIDYLKIDESPFNRKVYLSQSSCDLMNLVDPDSTDFYGSFDYGQAWVEFRFPSAIPITAIRIKHLEKSAPKSFLLYAGEGHNRQILAQTSNADLNAPGKEFELQFNKVSTNYLRLEQTGPNWDGTGFFNLGKIEFISPDRRFVTGVFRTLFNDHRQDIRSFVEVRARDRDLEELHIPNNRTNVATWSHPTEWIQIEIVGGTFVIGRYRLKRTQSYMLRTWSIRGSNDASLPLDQWTEIDKRHEETEGQYGEFDSFPAVGGPFRYYRLVCDGERWDGRLKLNLYHLDLFGLYISD